MAAVKASSSGVAAAAAAAAAGPAGGSGPDVARWVVVYPAYLDSGKTLQEGRRIPKDGAVGVARPQLVEVYEAMKKVGGLEFAAEKKSYSRDAMTPGRLRVKLFDEGTREPVREDLPSRRALFEAIGRELPAVRVAIQERMHAATAKPGSSGGPATTKKKKNRK